MNNRLRTILPFAASLALLPATARAAFDSVVVINEIQYNPASSTASEWIELRNMQGVDVNMGGWSLAGGIDFTFPPGFVIPGGGHIVVAAVPGMVPGSMGPFSGNLSNSGEVVRVVNKNGRIMDEVEYGDSGDWPTGPDGTGPTLSRRIGGAGDLPALWTASNEIGGTPGKPNFFERGILPARLPLVTTGSVWSFSDSGAEPPADWKSLDFDASAWASGPGVFTGGGATADALQPALSGAAVNLTSWWKLGENAGETVPNLVAGGLTGTLTNGVTWVTDPERGQVAEFDGVDDRIAFATATITPRQTLTTDFTWSCWAKSAASAVTDTPGDSHDGPAEQGAAVILGNRGKLDGTGNMSPVEYTKMTPSGVAYVRGSGVSESLTESTALNDTGVWHHLVLVKKAGTLTLWKDGAVISARNITAGQAVAMPFFIGGDPMGTGESFKGRISDVAVWTRALPARSIRGLAAKVYDPGTAPTVEATTVPPGPGLPTPVVGTQVQAGPQPRYFRTEFEYSGDPARSSLELWATADDGAVYYLNGVELSRVNVPPTAQIANATFAAAATALPAGQLRAGRNVLTAEVHQFTDSNDLLFAAALNALETPAPAQDLTPTLVFSEISGAVDADFRLEMLNRSASPLNLTGWELRASSGETVPLPAQTVAAGARLVVSAADMGFTPVDGTRLTLVRADGFSVTDSRAVTNRLRGLTAGNVWGHPDAPSFGAANTATVSDAVVINEIYYKSRDTSPEQWIELYNKSASAVDISGWKFSDGIDYLFPAATTIPAGGFLVVAWDPAAFAALRPGVTALGPWSGNLSGKGELLRLRDAADNITDEVPYYDSGRWPIWADGEGTSLELRDPASDNSQGEAWTESDETARGQWETITYQGTGANSNAADPADYNEFVTGLLTAGDVLIDDISVREDPAGTNRELIQNGDFSSGAPTFWRLIGNHRSSTVVDDPSSPGNKVLKISTSGPTEHMSNHAETTLKFGSSYVTINPSRTYRISLRARWLRGSNQLNTRLWHNRLPKSTILSAPNNGGTPGAVNSTRVANAGPTFTELRHAPVIPPVNQPATVSVKIADPQGVASAELFISANGGAWSSSPMAAGTNGEYSAAVTGRALNTKVQFYVKAVDTAGAVSFFPAGGAASRAMIQWNDNASLFTLPTGARPHNLRVVMTPADQTFIHTNINQMSNEKLPCTFIYDDTDVYYNASVRLKSSEHGRFNDTRVGYIIDFGRDEAFLGTHTTIAVDRSGGLASNQYEILVRAVMNAAGGIYSTEDDIIRIIGTRSSFTGPAILSKSRFDSEYLDGQWTDGADGTMFKYERVYVQTQTTPAGPEGYKYPQDSTGPPGVAVGTLGTDKERYRWYWLIRNNRAQDDYTRLIPSVTALGQANNATFQTQTSQLVDGDSFLRSLTPGILFGVVDNYTTNAQHNAIFYFPPNGKMVHIPWDLDYLDQTAPTASMTTNTEQMKYMQNAAWRRIYWGHVLDVINNGFNDAFVTKWATHYSRFGISMTSTLPFLRQRETYARGQVTTAVPYINFAITTAGPLNVVTPTATVAGDGWVDVGTIRLQGNPAPLPVTWTDANSWRIDLPVRGGTNVYTLEAVSRQGVVFGTGSITITAASGLFPASTGTVIVSQLNFNPSGSGDQTEFVELMNITGDTLDLSGCHFDDEDSQGFAYTFPAGQHLAPGARVVVARDPAAFALTYPGVTGVLGPYTGALDNAGESIVLYAANGSVIFRFAYSDSAPGTDGDGYTLVRVISPTAPNPNDYTWRPSMSINGTPGESDAAVFTGDPSADVDKDGSTALMEYAFGTSDNDPSAMPPPPDYFMDGDVPYAVIYATLPNADAVVQVVETSTDLNTWIPQTEDTLPAATRRYYRLRVTSR